MRTQNALDGQRRRDNVGRATLNGQTVTLSGSILDSSPLPILIADASGLARSCNAAADEVVNMLDSPGGGPLKDLIARAARDNAALSEKVKLTGPKGEVQYEVKVIPIGRGDGVLVIAGDVTLDRALQTALVDSRQRYKDLVEISSDFAWETGSDGAFVFVSPRGALGFVSDELVGRNPDVFLLDPVEIAGGSPFKTQTLVDGVEVWMRQSDGRPACLSASAAPLLDTEGNWIGARGVCRDITEMRERDAALARARNRERMLTYIVRTFRDEVDPEKMLAVAAQGIARGLSADGCQIFHAEWDMEKDRRRPLAPASSYGVTGGEDLAQSLESGLAGGAEFLELSLGAHEILSAATHFQRRVNGAVCLHRRAGKGAWSDDDRILIGDIANQIGIAIEQIFNHMRIIEISRTDPLTGLYNRRAFFEELGRHFVRLAVDRKHGALMYLDLDNFKAVNDKFGHKKGDEVLIRLRDILVTRTRPTDLISRLGGDEFALWLDGADSVVAEQKARDLLSACSDLHRFSAAPDKPLEMSIGIAVHDPLHDAETQEEMIHRADEAMYAAKQAGRNRTVIFDPDSTGAI